MDAWNATVQRQLTNKTSLEVGYVGNHGSHVFKGNGNTYNPNQATVVGFLPARPGLSYNRVSPYNNAFSTPYTDQNGVTTTRTCCSGYSFGYNGDDGTNTYNALQIKLDHRTSSRLNTERRPIPTPKPTTMMAATSLICVRDGDVRTSTATAF